MKDKDKHYHLTLEIIDKGQNDSLFYDRKELEAEIKRVLTRELYLTIRQFELKGKDC